LISQEDSLIDSIRNLGYSGKEMKQLLGGEKMITSRDGKGIGMERV
jgi:hypothetical protein